MSELDLSFPSTGTTVTTSGITLEEHENIDSLVHNLSEDGFTEIIKDSNGQVTTVNVRVSDGGTLIRSTSLSRNGQGQVATIVENQHDVSGSIVQTKTTTLNRSANGQVESVEVVET